MRALLLFCMLPVVVFAQSYFEASGQTAAFTMAAGAKAGWNPSIAVEKAGVLPAITAFRISVASNGLFVHAGSKGVVKLFDVRGRMAISVAIEHDGFVALSRNLANGIYAARFEAPGMALKRARLAVVR
jgi:hypothetical protein